MMSKWHKDIVIKGNQFGRNLGFPTLNLKNTRAFEGREGVYVVKTWINNKEYAGLLYFGPKHLLSKTSTTLEIFLFDFDDNINGQEIEYRVLSFIRPPIRFIEVKEYKKQLALDCQKAKEILAQSSQN